MMDHKEQKHQQLLSILLSQYRFHTKPYSLDNYSIDLILVVNIPSSPDKILRKQILPLSMMRKKISPITAQAYKQALKRIQIHKPQTNDNQIWVANIGSLQKHQDQIQTNDFEALDQVVKYNYQGTQLKDLFTVNLNMLIYTLQKQCGFNVQKYIINDKVYLLLNCQHENLRRAAVLHKIKKQIIYSEVDIYLNQPIDSKNRPISLNKQFKSKRRSSVNLQQNTQELILFNQKTISNQLLKTYHRKLGDVQNYNNQIIDEVDLSQRQVQKFEKFMNQYAQLLKSFDQSPISQNLDINQLNYVREIMNKNGENINQGALKIFKQIKRKRNYFESVAQLVQKSGYKTFMTSSIYTSYFELNKKKKYADRVRSLMMFKPLIVGPGGQLQLFLRMEKTRLSYLILLQYFRIQNFPLFGIQFFTLHNSFQKYGITSGYLAEGVNGGLDGHNLQKSWSVFTPWKSDVKIIRDYLGQSFAYFTFLKNRLISALMIFSPIALIAFLIIILVLPLNLGQNSHLDTFVFFTVYSFIILIWFSAYSIRQDQSQAFHFGTLRQKSMKKTPNFGYQSPYVRNLITDSINEYREVKSIFNRMKQFLVLLFVIALLCIDIGIFYGIRSWSIVLQYQIPKSNLFFQWYQFIPLFLFFMGNHIVYMFGLKKLFKYITSLQNNPNLQKDQSSYQIKCLVFRIGVQLIGPIDLMVVEALGSYNCYDSSCWNAYESFINIRFIVVFIILIIRFVTFLVQKLINKQKIKKQTQKDLKQIEQNRQSQSRIKKLFIKIIKQYSKKQYTIDIEEQILILVHFSLFSMIQPISTLINLLMTLLDFYLQRLQILKGARRPINKSMSTPNYQILIKVPFYIFCSFNSWLLLVNFEDLEYVNPQFYLNFLSTPSKDALRTLKIVFGFGLFCSMLLFEFIFRKIYNSNNQESQLILRKQKKLTNYLYKYKKTKAGAWNNTQKPIVHIGRVKF